MPPRKKKGQLNSDKIVNTNPKTVKRQLLGRSKVTFTQHAVFQMKQRGISEKHVYLTVEEPTESGLKVSGPLGRKRVRRDWTAGTFLEVVYSTLPDEVIIITAIKTKRSRGKRSR